MVNNKYLVQLVDGAILDVIYDEDCYPGCPTCGYGSEYIREWWVKMTDHVIHVKVNNEYDYGISAGWIMKLFLQNMPEIKKMKQVSLFDFIKDEVRNYIQSRVDCPSFDVLLDDDSRIPSTANSCH